MHDFLDDHLSEIVGRKRREDDCVPKTIGGLIIASYAVSVVFAGFAGKYAADHLSADSARRLSRGDLSEVARLIPVPIPTSHPDHDGPERGAREKV